MKRGFKVISFKETNFAATDKFLEDLVAERKLDRIEDCLLLGSYEKSLSTGVRELRDEDLLKPLADFEKENIFLYKATRGGGITYHWPGQLLVYPVFKLTGKEQNINKFMHSLEEIALKVLSSFNIRAERREDSAAHLGLWCQGRKIVSMGIHISQWVTNYGFALNICGDYGPANFINPCGLKGVKLITMSEILETNLDRELISERIIKVFSEISNK